jgi:hypothetical protein
MLRIHLIEVSTVVIGLRWVALAMALVRARTVSHRDAPSDIA